MFTNIEFLCNFHKFISAQQVQSLALFRISFQTALFRAGSVQIQDLAKGGPASEAESSQHSKAE